MKKRIIIRVMQPSIPKAMKIVRQPKVISSQLPIAGAKIGENPIAPFK